jgi:hypothetical protein
VGRFEFLLQFEDVGIEEGVSDVEAVRWGADVLDGEKGTSIYSS